MIALGVMRGLGAGLSNLAGGEVTEITKLVHDGRKNAYGRMIKEAGAYGGIGIAGVSFDLVNHGGNLEFIALGSTIHQQLTTPEKLTFSTSADAQELYCQMDANFTPSRFVFGNVAYSIGVGGSIKGAFRGLARGEVTEYTRIFDVTRHLALERIKNEAKAVKANAVIGIETSIMPLMGVQEMIMIGTASNHPQLAPYAADPVTSDLTTEELWNLVNIGYLPLQLVMGVSVYSLGFTSGVTSSLKSLVGGEVGSLTELLYEAREKAFARIQADAQKCGADEVVGVKTRVYDMGGGLVEFMVIGTAVKKFEGVKTKNEILPPQAIIKDRETFVDTTLGLGFNVATSSASSARALQRGPARLILTIFIIALYIFIRIMTHHR